MRNRFRPCHRPLRLAAITAVLGAAAVTSGGAAENGWPTDPRADFGRSVAVVGEDVLVGEPRPTGESGVIYIYRRSGEGWTRQGEIRATDQPNDGFGFAMAADGNTIVIGALNQGSPAGASAYIYERDGSGEYRQVARLWPNDSAGVSFFGYSVAIDGSTVVVGAPLDGGTEASPQSGTGAVYVFQRDAAGQWSRTSRVVPSDAAEQGVFGVSVALDGDRAFALSPRTGLYALQRDANGWREAAKVAIDGTEPADQLGAAMLLSGETALIGAPNRAEGTGTVYVLRAADAGWTVTGEIAPPAEARRFGAALTLGGDRLYIGAPATADNRGVVHSFTGQGAQWQHAAAIAGEGLNAGDQFGGAIAGAGDRLAVSLPRADHGLGKVAIFEGGPAAWTQAALLVGEAATMTSVAGGEVACAQGKAADFSCGSVDLLSFLSIQDIGGERGVELNDIWGWTDPESAKEYALVGRIDGTSFIDISNPSQPVYIGQLPMTTGSQANSWRDIKVYRDHAYVVADGAGQHGIQVIDLTKLRQYAGSPITFEADTVYDRVASAHNIVINEESGFAYAVGSNSGGETCGGGLHMVDIREPKQPKFAGCFADTETGTQRTGYSHDAQCVTYKGPDTQYQGREICIGSNETAISVGDVTDKASPKPISRASYPNVSYTHQGWFTDDHRYFLVNDEGDEVSGVVPRTRTLVWDLADLDDPQLVKEYLGETAASDHNLYIKGNLVYESNYASGLRIIDITDPLNPREVGFFDTQPVGENVPGFTGSWSNYPFFRSGVIAVSSIEQGVFFLRYKPSRPVS
jgi:choice-of-anchor B domain-containing protein